ncbi:MAG: hypothetical protein FJ279_11935 [Planctomycetes bacterium]|nr:hypothetical protein [Planctomycetota bacterium]
MATTVVGVVILLLLLPSLFGWIVPLVFGIRRIRRKTGGVVLTVVGGVWGLLALCLVGLIGWLIWVGLRAMRVEDFDPRKYEGRMGRIALSHKAESELMLMGEKRGKRIRFKTADGAVLVPEGKYRPFEYATFSQDEAGAKWKASCYLFRGMADSLSVSAESVSELAVGPPFTARVTVGKESAEEVALDLKVTGQGGDGYTIRRADGKDEPPGFEVVGPDGKVVLRDRFKFG